jgi:hypothetical protein
MMGQYTTSPADSLQSCDQGDSTIEKLDATCCNARGKIPQ